MLVKRRDSESDCRGRFREDKVDMAKTGLFDFKRAASPLKC